MGTVCMTAGLVRFETTRAAVLPVGQLQVDVPARALLAGSAGNAAAGTVLKPSGGNCAVLPKGFAAPSAEKISLHKHPRFFLTRLRRCAILGFVN